MSKPKSQTVRLKEEILSALSDYSETQGVTQQHVVSVGAWFYMCIPTELREALNSAFYGWCQSGISQAGLPREVSPLLSAVVAAIHEECKKHRPKTPSVGELLRRLAEKNDQGAEAAAQEAAEDRKGETGVAKRRGKGRRTA